MSLDLLNDSLLDIKVHSIQSIVPIGGGIADNSILNIKLVDKTVENTKIKDGTIISSLLANDISISGNLGVAGDLTVPTGSLTVGNADITNNLTVSNSLSTTQLHINNGTGSYSTSGMGTLSGGAITIATSAVGASSFVLLTRTSDPTNDGGIFAVMNILNGVCFDVFSSVGADNGTFNWLIINPL